MRTYAKQSALWSWLALFFAAILSNGCAINPANAPGDNQVETNPSEEIIEDELAFMTVYGGQTHSTWNPANDTTFDAATILYTEDGGLPYTVGYVEAPAFTAEDIPEYAGSDWVEINNGYPFFVEIPATEFFISLSEYDALGRCGPAMMLMGAETMQFGTRSDMGNGKPTGWVQKKYPGIVGNETGNPWLLQRTHLLGWFATGLTGEYHNLISMTQQANGEAMLTWEMHAAYYVEDTGNHIVYRVTPIFQEDDLMCQGVLMEGVSIEEPTWSFCVFIYNRQNGIILDYATGISKAAANIP